MSSMLFSTLTIGRSWVRSCSEPSCTMGSGPSGSAGLRRAFKLRGTRFGFTLASPRRMRWSSSKYGQVARLLPVWLLSVTTRLYSRRKAFALVRHSTAVRLWPRLAISFEIISKESMLRWQLRRASCTFCSPQRASRSRVSSRLHETPRTPVALLAACGILKTEREGKSMGSVEEVDGD